METRIFFWETKQHHGRRKSFALLPPPPLCHHKTQICQTVKIAYSTHVESEAEKVFRSILKWELVAIFGKAVFRCLWSSINHTTVHARWLWQKWEKAKETIWIKSIFWRICDIFLSPFALLAASAIFWNESRNAPRTKMVLLEKKKEIWA